MHWSKGIRETKIKHLSEFEGDRLKKHWHIRCHLCVKVKGSMAVNFLCVDVRGSEQVKVSVEMEGKRESRMRH